MRMRGYRMPGDFRYRTGGRVAGMEPSGHYVSQPALYLNPAAFLHLTRPPRLTRFSKV